MGMTQHAYIGWGVALLDDDGDYTHESVDKDVLWDFSERDGYRDVIELSHGGHCDYSFPVVYLKRSYDSAYWGSAGVTSYLTPPTKDEEAWLNQFLDEIKYTGPREIKLLLVASYG